MAETATEKAVCVNCGSDVREGTSFCYNCGKPVAIVTAEETPAEEHTSNGSAAAVSNEAQAALDDLAERFKAEDVSKEHKLAQAAAERKRARVRSRRSEVVWEAPDAAVNLWFVVFTLVIVVLTAILVAAALYWK